MEFATATSEPRALSDERQPWHKPIVQRLEINTETKAGGASTDDGPGFGLIFDLAD